MSDQRNIVRPVPCRACPYRRDVPSGVWSANEYAKLEDYDRETGAQPMASFACHATPKRLCAGWATCHGYSLLALRFESLINRKRVEIPKETVPLFTSGKEAADHGRRDIENPSPEAIEMMAYLQEKHPRLR